MAMEIKMLKSLENRTCKLRGFNTIDSFKMREKSKKINQLLAK